MLDATDLVALIGEHVTLRAKGREHVGLCPFHDDRSPSMHVVSHKGTPFYKCFSCGAGGNAIDFVMNYHKMPFPDALTMLATRAGLTLEPRHDTQDESGQPTRREIVAAHEFALEYFRKVLGHTEAGREGREILRQRGVSDDMVEAFAVGLAPDRWDGLLEFARSRKMELEPLRVSGLIKRTHTGSREIDAFRDRLIFPIFDQLGRPIAFGARKIKAEDEPKYLNSPEHPAFHKSNTLYGLHLARRAIAEADAAIITEGYTDVIALHQAGFRNAVATLGTSLTSEHARILERLCESVILLFDGDAAGRRAADRAVEIFFAYAIEVRICILPGDADPDDLLKRENGRELLHAALSDAEPALSFLVRQLRNDLSATDTLSGRQRLIESLLQRLADLGFASMSGLRKRLVLPMLADLLGVSLQDLERALPQSRRRHEPVRHESAFDETTPERSDRQDDTLRLPHANVPRAQRAAEVDLVSVLMWDASLRHVSVDAGDGHALPITELYPVDCMLDPTTRAVYQVVHDMYEADQDFAVGDLLSRLGAQEYVRAATTWYDHLESLQSSRPRPSVERLQEAVEALERLRRSESFRSELNQLRQAATSTDAQSVNTLSDAIEARRRQGTNHAALARGLRA